MSATAVKRTLPAAVDSDVVTIHFPSAILWDMDGTLVDTEPYWMAAEKELVESRGGTWSAEEGLALVGQGLEFSAAALQSSGVDLSTGDIIERLTKRVLDQTLVHVPWRPGALELLKETRDAGISTALVTMSMKPLAQHIANAAEERLFDAVVTGDDVARPKPHPEPYELAARLLDVDPASCVAIEDSVPGLASAAAAGAVVIAVPAHVAIPESTEYSLWPSLAGRSLDDVTSLYQSLRAPQALREDLV
ncbi:MAG: HAD family phosphatase [Cryobacterium sp.]|nr:HAD family phosphatase [Cryobacterium sp.]